MKKLKIGDISRIYKLSLDSLRYYERIGLISPSRQENQYREYDYVDLWKLNIIKELRRLGFEFSVIREYLNNRSLASTKDFLRKALTSIDAEIAKLTELRKNLDHSLGLIEKGVGSVVEDVIRIKHFDERPCIQVAEMVQTFWQVDFYFRKLQLKSDESIPLLWNKTLCVSMDVRRLDQEETFYSKVFSFLPGGSEKTDFSLPAGDYLSVYYRGDHHQSRLYALKLLDYAKEQGLRIIGEPFEICHIDIHETQIRDEYVTEVQLGIRHNNP